MSIFGHHHRWKTEFVHNGATVGARIDRCACGEERRELTPAGRQQVGWWMDQGLTVFEAELHVWAGDYPLAAVVRHAQAHPEEYM